ncbi:DNA replication atp-dependent helicase/nuclease DNA2 [Anaeramoeba ignava]|uniref:DNA replication atp-dependent helicase/nuclease DNA2 n=1 Tax=Anaeramoeba ignava TaxID=1746090 RepID=A0A9Q0LQA1_ANAIG|nr:DNA replication atp-dependent helicase/nuclease DNA2 [Anaeramoeba ignava]
MLKQIEEEFLIVKKISLYKQLKILQTITPNSKTKFNIILKGKWTELNISEEDHIKITIDEKSKMKENEDSITISNETNSISVNPEIFINMTDICSGSWCLRKSVLSSVFIPFHSVQAVQLMQTGEIAHEIFEHCLLKTSQNSQKNANQTNQILFDVFDEEIQKKSVNILLSEETISQMKTKLNKFIFNYLQWKKKYMDNYGKIKVARMKYRRQQQEFFWKVDSLVSVEEKINSLSYGFVGKIDSVVKSTFSEVDPKIIMQNPELDQQKKKKLLEPKITPLEYKNSEKPVQNSQIEQVQLYLKMLSEKYNSEVDHGILHYFKKSIYDNTVAVLFDQSIFSDLLFRRNLIALHRIRNTLPKIDTSIARSCAKCQFARFCAIYDLLQSGTEKNHDKFYPTNFLTNQDLQFLKIWNLFLDKESTQSYLLNQEIWTQPLEERIRLGLTIGDLELIESDQIQNNNENENENENENFIETKEFWNYKFRRLSQNWIPQKFIKGAYIALVSLVSNPQINAKKSIHPKIICEARIISITNTLVEIETENQIPLLLSVENDTQNKPTFRIDVSFSISNHKIQRTNIFQFVVKNNKIRQILFQDAPHLLGNLDNQTDISGIPLSLPQTANSVEKAKLILDELQSTNYIIISGLPGTGKTHLAANIAQEILKRNSTVLVVSSSKFGLKRILGKFVEDQVSHNDILSFVKMSSSTEEMEKYYLNYKFEETEINSQEDLKKFQLKIQNFPIVALTVKEIYHSLLVTEEIRFDYCIIDDANELNVPSSLGPLVMAHKFILLGHSSKNPPSILSSYSNSEIEMYSPSLLEILEKNVKRNSIQLKSQFVVNQEIMDLANSLNDDENQMVCFDQEISQSVLKPNTQDEPKKHDNPKLEISHFLEQKVLSKIINPENPVIFISMNRDFLQNAKKSNDFPEIEDSFPSYNQPKESIKPDDPMHDFNRTFNSFNFNRNLQQTNWIHFFNNRTTKHFLPSKKLLLFEFNSN